MSRLDPVPPSEMCWAPEDDDVREPLPRWAAWVWAGGILGSWGLALGLIWLVRAWMSMP
jgi:hypothetical protein